MSEPYQAVGNDYTVIIPAGDGTDLTIDFVMSIREGAHSSMVIETVKHFCIALESLANGRSDVPTGRTGYEPCPYNRVLISYANVYVLQENGAGNKRLVTKKALMFTEHTSAARYVDLVKGCVWKIDPLMQEIGIIVHTGHSKATAPRNNNPSQQQAPQQQPTMPPILGNSGTTPYYEQFPGRQELGENYDQTVVAIGIQQIDVGFSNGQRIYEMYSSYRGDVSQWGFDTTRIYGTKKNGETFQAVKDNATVAYLEGLEMGTHKVNTRAVYWVNKSTTVKRNKDGEEYFPVYLNLNKLDIAHENAPKSGEESQLPPGGFDDVLDGALTPETKGIEPTDPPARYDDIPC